ncbi:hypothetical protein Acor_05440 [Acrocarpospora corrugata]|uniref:Uncharacterized protein n=1 Tax=Acrocarpospora corrugata TaxID=35763 RepID=A0A5M3VTQ6_9ACTN|nr:hypothetical protein Acor_05440 [Acrocarpospora corrugata]
MARIDRNPDDPQNQSGHRDNGTDQLVPISLVYPATALAFSISVARQSPRTVWWDQGELDRFSQFLRFYAEFLPRLSSGQAASSDFWLTGKRTVRSPKSTTNSKRAPSAST